MTDIYSPPEADIRVPQDVESTTFLKSLGGFIVSLLAVNVLNYVAGVFYTLLERYGMSATVTMYVSIIFTLVINVGWIVAWPVYCRKRGWPNLYRGGRWHRLFFVTVLLVGFATGVFFAVFDWISEAQ